MKNHYIDLDPPGSEPPYYGEETVMQVFEHQQQHSQYSPQDINEDMAAADEISRKFVLIAKKKGISITKSKKSLRNGSKIWSRRNSY